MESDSFTYLMTIVKIAYTATPKVKASNEINPGFSSENPGIFPNARYAQTNPMRPRITPSMTFCTIPANPISNNTPLMVEKTIPIIINMMNIGGIWMNL